MLKHTLQDNTAACPFPGRRVLSNSILEYKSYAQPFLKPLLKSSPPLLEYLSASSQARLKACRVLLLESKEGFNYFEAQLSSRCFKQIWKVGKVGKVGKEGKEA
jgi:hypothetical protein